MSAPPRRGAGGPARTELRQRMLATCEHYVYRPGLDAIRHGNRGARQPTPAEQAALRWLLAQGLIRAQMKDRISSPRPLKRTGRGEETLAAWREAFGAEIAHVFDGREGSRGQRG